MPVASLSNTVSVGLSCISRLGRGLALSSQSLIPGILCYMLQFSVTGWKHGVTGRNMVGCIH